MLYNFYLYKLRLQQRHWIYTSFLLLLNLGCHFQSLVKAHATDVSSSHTTNLPLEVPHPPPNTESPNTPVQTPRQPLVAQIEEIDNLHHDDNNNDNHPESNSSSSSTVPVPIGSENLLPSTASTTQTAKQQSERLSSNQTVDGDSSNETTTTAPSEHPKVSEYIARPDTNSSWKAVTKESTSFDQTDDDNDDGKLDHASSGQRVTLPLLDLGDDDDGSGYVNFTDDIVVGNNDSSNNSRHIESGYDLESQSIFPISSDGLTPSDSVQSSISAGRNSSRHSLSQDIEKTEVSSHQATSTITSEHLQTLARDDDAIHDNWTSSSSVQSSMVIAVFTASSPSSYATDSLTLQSSPQRTTLNLSLLDTAWISNTFSIASTSSIAFPTLYQNEIEVMSRASTEKLGENTSLQFSPVPVATETTHGRQSNNDSWPIINTSQVSNTSSTVQHAISVTSATLSNGRVSTRDDQLHLNQTTLMYESTEDSLRQVTPRSGKDLTSFHIDKDSHKNVVENVLNGDETTTKFSNSKGHLDQDQQNHNLNDVLRSNLDQPSKPSNNSNDENGHTTNKMARKQNDDEQRERVTVSTLKPSKVTTTVHHQQPTKDETTMAHTPDLVPTSTVIQTESSTGSLSSDQPIINTSFEHRLPTSTPLHPTKTGHKDTFHKEYWTPDDEAGQHHNEVSTDNPTKNLHSLNAPSSYLTVTMQCSWSYFCKHRKDFQIIFAKHLSKNNYSSVGDSQIQFFDINACNHVVVDEEDVNDVVTKSISVSLYVTDNGGGYNQWLTERLGTLILNKTMAEEAGHNTALQDMVLIVHMNRKDTNNNNNNSSSSSSSSSSKLSPNNDNMGIIAAVTISSIAGAALLLLFLLLIIMKRRYGMKTKRGRCRPVTDAYSLDSMSIYSSFRKMRLRASKRSYLNQGFEDPNAPSNKLTYSGLVNFFFSKDNIIHEFKKIPMTMAKLDELPPGVDTKNRYANVIPFSESRVNLTAKPDDPSSEYINANYVRGFKGDPHVYIACQAPLENTVSDFWQMVWENQAKVIIMLTDFVEDGVEKCAIYFSDSTTTDCHKLYGDYQVTTKEIDIREKFVISFLQLRNLEKNLVRDVVHFWYTAWPTQGVPNDKQSIIEMLSEARLKSKTGHGPVIVHCSPGTGRTGTVIASDICIQEYDAARTVDIPHIVYHLRMDRGGLVQTTDQYMYIYEVIKEYASQIAQYSGRSSVRSSK